MGCPHSVQVLVSEIIGQLRNREVDYVREVDVVFRHRKFHAVFVFHLLHLLSGIVLYKCRIIREMIRKEA